MQDSIAKAVVAALAVQLGGELRAAPKRASTNPEAYDAYLRGRYFLGRRDSTSLTKALDYLDRAITLDPAFAPAYAALGEAYADMTVFSFVAPETVRAKAEAASLKSLQLDESNVEGHTSRGFIALNLNWDVATAQREFTRALAIDRRYAPAYLYRAILYTAIADTAAALRDAREAVRLDPYSLIANTRLATYLSVARRYREAAAQARHVREMDSTFTQARGELVRAEIALGNCDLALAEVRTMPHVRLEIMPVHALAYAHCAPRADAEAELARFDEQRRHGVYVSQYAYAVVSAALGRDDAALAHLDTGVTEHAWAVIFAPIEPEFDRIKKDPRFDAIVRRVSASAR